MRRCKNSFHLALALVMLGGAGSYGIAQVQAQAPAPAAGVDARRETGQMTHGGAAIREIPVDQGAAPGPYIAPEESDVLGIQAILYRPPVYNPWYLYTVAGVYGTDNVALSPVLEEDDVYVRLGAGVRYAPQLTDALFAEFGAAQHFYLYDKFDVLDFDYTDATAGLIYIPPPTGTALDRLLANSLWFLRYHYYRIGESGFGDQIFDNHGLQAGFQKAVPIFTTHTLYLGFYSDISLDAENDFSRRDEHVISASYRIQWTHEFFTYLTYRAAYYDYYSFGREDWNHSIDLTAEYRVTGWATLYASIVWVKNESNLSAFDYERGDIGAAVGLQLAFGGEPPRYRSATPAESPGKNPVSGILTK